MSILSFQTYTVQGQFSPNFTHCLAHTCKHSIAALQQSNAWLSAHAKFEKLAVASYAESQILSTLTSIALEGCYSAQNVTVGQVRDLFFGAGGGNLQIHGVPTDFRDSVLLSCYHTDFSNKWQEIFSPVFSGINLTESAERYLIGLYAIVIWHLYKGASPFPPPAVFLRLLRDAVGCSKKEEKGMSDSYSISRPLLTIHQLLPRMITDHEIQNRK